MTGFMCRITFYIEFLLRPAAALLSALSLRFSFTIVSAVFALALLISVVGTATGGAILSVFLGVAAVYLLAGLWLLTKTTL